MVVNPSSCGQVDSEALVDCLRGKSEEEILDINKVGLSGCMCVKGGGEQVWGSRPFTHQRQVASSPCPCVLIAQDRKSRPGHAEPGYVGASCQEGVDSTHRASELNLCVPPALQDHPRCGRWDLPAQTPPGANGLC